MNFVFLGAVRSEVRAYGLSFKVAENIGRHWGL